MQKTGLNKKFGKLRWPPELIFIISDDIFYSYGNFKIPLKLSQTLFNLILDNIYNSNGPMYYSDKLKHKIKYPNLFGFNNISSV